MATDATGTPTAKGIPKYDPANDAPSGLGFNAAMDAIDTLLGWVKLRKNSGGSEFSRGRLNLIEGSGITITMADDAGGNEVDVTIAATGAGPVDHGLVTALPGSPSNGDTCTFTDSTTAPTYQWQLRFVSAKASNKWIFIGGSDMANDLATSNNTTSTSYVAPGTTQELTIPVAGQYDVEIGAQGIHAGTDNGFLSYTIGGAAASDANAAHWRAGAGEGFTSSQISRITAAASDVIAVRFKTSAGTFTVQDRRLRIVPVAIGG